MTYSTGVPQRSMTQSCLSNGAWYPRSVFHRARGVNFCELPEKATSLGPPQLQRRIVSKPNPVFPTQPSLRGGQRHAYLALPLPSSHSLISFHARSFTALWIGTMLRMSSTRGSNFLRRIALKNISSLG